MVSLLRKGKELSAIGAADSFDAARQCAILVLKQEEGLMIGDQLTVTRI
jgi:hypothetical protein